MAPRTSRSSGKIVIRPRTGRSGGTPASSSRPTIRIGPRAAAARHETPEEFTEPEDAVDGSEAGDNVEVESSLTSNNGASTSRVMTPADGEDSMRDDEEKQAVEDVDVEGDDAASEIVEELDADDDEDAAPQPKRARGRPRGRPKGSGVGTPRPRKSAKGKGKARGRPAKSRRDDDDVGSVAEDGAEGEETGGKPFRRINGQVYVIDGDEFITENNPKGDTKIDEYGNLLGGRQFKAQTFALPNRHPERKYMLAIDAARSSGFRDSLYYFRRNPLAFKLNATQWEKEYLIDEGKLGSHLRTRSVTLITARSAYKLHGAKMIRDGRWVIDDYDEDKFLEEITARGLKPGDYVGDLQETSNVAAEAAALNATATREAGKQERSAGLGMYRAGGPTTIFGGSGWGPYSDGPLNAVRKSLYNREGLNEENWMYVSAQRTIEENETWKQLRRDALAGYASIWGDSLEPPGSPKRGIDEIVVDDSEVETKRRRLNEGSLPLGMYDAQTGLVFYRADTQPTESRWEWVEGGKKSFLGGTKVGSGAWSIAHVDVEMELPDPQEKERLAEQLMQAASRDVA